MSNSQSFGAKALITTESEFCEKQMSHSNQAAEQDAAADNTASTEEIMGKRHVQKIAQPLEIQLQAQASRLKQLMAQNRTLQDQLDDQKALIQQLHQAETAALQAEKMSTLGMLLAGVAHELNTPLGAIQASAGNLSASVAQVSCTLPQLCQCLNPEKQAALIQLLSWAATPNSRSSREERQLKRALRAELQALDIGNASSLAATLSNMGVVVSALEQLLPILNSDHAELFLDVAHSISMIQQNSQNISTAVGRADSMVSSLRRYARKSQAQPIRVDLQRGLETVLTLYQNKLKYGIEVQASYSDTLPLLCYPEELEQAWANLIGNAIQAMDGKGILQLALTQDGDNIRVDITDSGPGISPENQAQIFTPYYTTKSREEGSGLGLAITQKIISRHRGSIEVNSSPGQTRFRVSIPLDGLVDAENDLPMQDSPFYFSLYKSSCASAQAGPAIAQTISSPPTLSSESPEAETASA